MQNDVIWKMQKEIWLLVEGFFFFVRDTFYHLSKLYLEYIFASILYKLQNMN